MTVPKGSKRGAHAVDFMKFILSDDVQVEGCAKLLNLTTRGDKANNQYFTDPRVVKMAPALDVARTPCTLGGTDWGMLQAGMTVSTIPCVGVYLLLQKYYVSGLLSGAVK